MIRSFLDPSKYRLPLQIAVHVLTYDQVNMRPQDVYWHRILLMQSRQLCFNLSRASCSISHIIVHKHI